MMKRREFISRRGGLCGRSPSPRSRAAIGFLKAHRRVHSYFVAAFRHGLREMDEVEDHSVAIEYRCVEGQNDRLPAFPAEAGVRGQVRTQGKRRGR